MTERAPPVWSADKIGTGCWQGPCWLCGMSIFGFAPETEQPIVWYCWECQQNETKRRTADFISATAKALKEVADVASAYEAENLVVKRAYVLATAEAWNFEEKLKEAGL